MLVTPFTVFFVSLGGFIILLWFTSLERRRGERLFAKRLRGALDRLVEAIEQWLTSTIRHIIRNIIQLHWYYSVHSILRAVLLFIQGLYARLERAFEKNRQRARNLRAEKRIHSALNHLREIAEHKHETALTPKEKQERKEKTLEDKY